MFKKLLPTDPVMTSPDYNKIFHVYTDASDIALESALMQEKTNGYMQSMYYVSKALTKKHREMTTPNIKNGAFLTYCSSLSPSNLL